MFLQIEVKFVLPCTNIIDFFCTCMEDDMHAGGMNYESKVDLPLAT